MTALARLIADLIRVDGPIGLDRYMALAAGHPTLGYYATRDPFGRTGDFTTAPEISQMFGEMLGLWAAAVWQAMGEPARLILVELGPGRGTLMADALRAARALPRFRAALDLHLVETSPVLRARQEATLAPAGVPVRWHTRLDAVSDGPCIVLANEFFDALPVKQYRRDARGWHERLVGLDEAGSLAFGLAPDPEPRLAIEAPEGAMIEVGARAEALVGDLARKVVSTGGAGLVLDYGYAASSFGETLQAVRRHRYADPLADPGEADLTAHVDFAALARAAAGAAAVVHGPVEQGAFLLGLGMAERAAHLAGARPDRAETVEAALRRLTEAGTPAEPGMGRLFKAMAVTAPGLPRPPGFDEAAPAVAPQIDPASTM